MTIRGHEISTQKIVWSIAAALFLVVMGLAGAWGTMIEQRVHAVEMISTQNSIIIEIELKNIRESLNRLETAIERGRIEREQSDGN